jgi:hypothetical protein
MKDETRLFLSFIVSIIVVIGALTLIGIYNSCDINTACVSLISVVLGGWIGILTPKSQQK